MGLAAEQYIWLKRHRPSPFPWAFAALACGLEWLNRESLQIAQLFVPLDEDGSVYAAVFIIIAGLICTILPGFQTKPWQALLLLASITICFYGLDKYLVNQTQTQLPSTSEFPAAVTPVVYGAWFGGFTWTCAAWLSSITFVVTGAPTFFRRTRSNGAVVFVHGLCGGAQTTWGDFPRLLATDPDLTEFDVLSWGYPSRIIGRVPSVAQAADALITELNERLRTYRRLVLVGHSLGGLVIQAMVIRALQSGRREELKRIRWIVTYGTPFDGAQLASFGRWFGRQMRDLSVNSQTVNELRNEWIDRVYNANIQAGEELFKLQIPVTTVAGLEDRVVPYASACGYFRKPSPRAVPGNHLSLKLPSSRGDIRYLVLKNVLIDIPSDGTSNDGLAPAPLGARFLRPGSHPVLSLVGTAVCFVAALTYLGYRYHSWHLIDVDRTLSSGTDVP